MRDCLRSFSKLACFGIFLFHSQIALSNEVVSTSLCGDAYVLAIADPQQIKSLSWQADSSLSFVPEHLRNRATAWPDREVLLTFAPALLVLGPGDKQSTTKLAVQRNSRVLQLSWSNNFADIERQMLAIGDFLNRTEQAFTVVARQQSRLQKLQQQTKTRKARPKVLYLTPTLGTAGAGTFVDAAIASAGATNMATEFGISGWGQVPIEALAKNQPDLIIHSFFADGSPSMLQFRANHSVVRTLRDQVPQITIAGGLWVCGGPYLVTAAEQIADALDELP